LGVAILDYSDDSKARELPRAFAKAKLPGGGRNFLHVASATALADTKRAIADRSRQPRGRGRQDSPGEVFRKGTGDGGLSGFGGIKTPFNHGETGKIRRTGKPAHGGVHVWVGGGFKGRGLSPDPSNGDL